MPTTNWEVKKQSPHYFYYSLERFFIAKRLRDLRSLLLLLFWESSEGESSGILTILMLSMTLMDLGDDLRALRPSNFYPPEGFYPTASYDAFWTRNEDLFLKRFRFRLPFSLIPISLSSLIQPVRVSSVVFLLIQSGC